MNTTKWGPHGWTASHVLVRDLPEQLSTEQQEWVQLFFTTMSFVLPCKYCRESFTKFLRQNPINPHLGTKGALVKWLYQMHNLVNDKLRKQKEGTGDYFPPNPSYSAAVKQIDNIGPGRFTRGLWLFLHAISMNYHHNPTPNKHLMYRVFFASLAHLSMPHEWNKRYNVAISDLETALQNPPKLFDYVYKVRQQVDSTTPNRNQLQKEVSSWRAKCKVFRGWLGGTCR